MTLFRRGKIVSRVFNSASRSSLNKSLKQVRKGISKQRWYSCKLSTVKLRSPNAPIGEPWPLKSLVGFDFPAKSQLGWGKLVIDVLRSRGWRFSTKPCHIAEDPCTHKFTVWMKEFEASLQGKSPAEMFGKKNSVQEGYEMKAVPLRSHALWLMTMTSFRIPGTLGGRLSYREDFVKAVVDHGAALPGSPGNYRIASFPGTETALFKTNLSAVFAGKPWWPVCYSLPKERDELLRNLGGNEKLWITKPKNECGGTGICVWSGDDPCLQRFIKENNAKSVVQSYLADPLLISGYKFHMRIHMIVTSLDPPRAFVQRNGQCLFATAPYTTAANTLGEAFDAPVHVTNMSFNATAQNKDNFLRSKPTVGQGQQFRVSVLEKLLAKNHPNYSKELLWGQVTHIAADVVRYLARAPAVRKFGKLVRDRHFELFGMDLMLDKDLNMFMCEVNTDPGLDYPDKTILGEPNPDFEKETGLSSDTWHDTFALIGLDSLRDQTEGSLQSWFEVEF